MDVNERYVSIMISRIISATGSVLDQGKTESASIVKLYKICFIATNVLLLTFTSVFLPCKVICIVVEARMTPHLVSETLSYIEDWVMWT